MKLKAADILKTDNVISLSPNSKLAEASSKFKSSHDAVMVVDGKQFVGVVNPYHALMRRAFPPTTKLANCLFSPPKLHLDTPLEEIARLMLESKVHYLPILDEANQLLGIATARRVLRRLKDTEQFRETAGDLVNGKRYLQTINLNSVFEEVLRFFQITKLSKVVIVNEENNLQGIISVFDILPIFSEPKERMGFFDKGEQVGALKKYTIKHFLKTSTVNVTSGVNLKEVIELILEKEIGSVIVMKNRLQPENIITTSDLLRHSLK